MSNGTFTKIGDSDKRMYGKYALLVCGFLEKEQQLLLNVLEQEKFDELPVIFVSNELMNTPLSELLDMPHKTGFGEASDAEKAIIMSGFAEAELQRLMTAYAGIGLPRPLWATVTPTSIKWTMTQLLTELAAEREAFKRK
jgi:hypothetical protein